MTVHPTPPKLDFQYETALIAEECGEVTQIIGKSFRFGWQSYDPANPSVTNLDLLHREVGDVLAAIQLATDRGLLTASRLETHKSEKMTKLSEIAPVPASFEIAEAGRFYYNYKPPVTLGNTQTWHDGNDGAGSGLDADLQSRVGTITTTVGTAGRVDTGLTASQEKAAATVSIVFVLALIAAVFFFATDRATDRVRDEAAAAASKCYQDALMMDISSATCESLKKIAGQPATPVAPPPAE